MFTNLNRGNSGTADISNGSIPQPIPRTRWISTRRSTLPIANPTIPIPIGGRDSAARIAMTVQLMSAVTVKCVGVHDWPLKQHHRRLEERHRDKQPAAVLRYKSCPHYILKKQNTLVSNRFEIKNNAVICFNCVQLFVLLCLFN